jgi:hypothetical protein
MPGYGYVCRCGADGLAITPIGQAPKYIECLRCTGLMRRDWRSVQIGVQSTPVGRNPEAVPAGLSKGWGYEKAIKGEHRPGGGFVPYLGGPDGELVTQRQWDLRGSTRKKELERQMHHDRVTTSVAHPST